MPSRINGIGTTYIGRKNVSQQQGVCTGCHRATMLQSYETKLWFSFFFIPVIPLGRKQVLDYCPHCSRHSAVDTENWQRIEQESIDESAAALAKNQDDPHAAIDMHATLAAFQRSEQANEFAGVIQTRFGDNVDVLLYLGSWFEENGKDREADASFAKALQLDPASPFAKRAVGVAMIEQGKLDEAQQLLADLQPPSENYDPTLFTMLARGFQSQNRHAEALQLYQLVQQQSPAIGQQKDFRTAVRESESALGQTESIVRSDPFYKSKPFVIGGIAAAVLVGIFVANYLVSQYRTLYVVNGLAIPITVSIDQGTPFSVEANSRRTVAIAEGRHQAVVTKPDAWGEATEFSIAAGWFDRFFASPAYVLDPSRSAIVFWEQTIYSANPSDRDNDYRLMVGEALTTFDDVDYFFEPFPDQISSERKGDFRKSRVDMVTDSMPAFLAYYPDEMGADAALDLLERHLKATPDDAELLTFYVGQAARADQTDRCLKQLAKGLAKRPVNVELHRLYQQVSEFHGNSTEIVKQYDAFVAAEPEDSALLYLRGRLAGTTKEAIQWLDRSLASNSENGYAWSSKCYHLIAEGDFESARPACDKALSLQPERTELAHLDRQLQFAQQQWPALKERLDRGVKNEPLSVQTRQNYLQLLAATGKLNEAESQQQAFADLVRREWKDDPYQLAATTRLLLLYLKRDYTEMLSTADGLAQPQYRAEQQFAANVETGDMDAAISALETADSTYDGYYKLCIGLAYDKQGNTAAADQWIESGVELLDSQGADNRYVADLIRRSEQNTISDDDARAITGQPHLKSIALLVLARNSTTMRATLLKMAEDLNFQRDFPYHFVNDVVAHLRSE